MWKVILLWHHLSQKLLTRRDKQNNATLIIQGNSFFISFTSENNRVLSLSVCWHLWVDVGECVHERNECTKRGGGNN